VRGDLARPTLCMGPEPSGLVSVAADPRLADPGDRDRTFGVKQSRVVLEQVST